MASTATAPAARPRRTSRRGRAQEGGEAAPVDPRRRRQRDQRRAGGDRPRVHPILGGGAGREGGRSPPGTTSGRRRVSGQARSRDRVPSSPAVRLAAVPVRAAGCPRRKPCARPRRRRRVPCLRRGRFGPSSRLRLAAGPPRRPAVDRRPGPVGAGGLADARFGGRRRRRSAPSSASACAIAASSSAGRWPGRRSHTLSPLGSRSETRPSTSSLARSRSALVTRRSQ